MQCESCGATLPDGASFCPACGAAIRPATAVQPDPSAAEQEIHTALAEANLLRLRRDLSGASRLCTDILRRSPRSASTHSLLGDICRDEGRLRDAMEWYKLALSLDPTRLSDRAKLDQLIDQVYSSPSATRADPAGDLVDDLSPRARQPGIGDWGQRALARFPRQWRARSGLAAGLIALGVLCVATLALYVVLSRSGGSAARPPQPAPSPVASGGLVAAREPQSPAESTQSRVEAPPTEQAVEPPPALPVQPSVIEREPAGSVERSDPLADLALREQRLQQALVEIAPQLVPPAMVAGVGIDPRQERAEIAFAVPEGADRAATREAILNAALTLGNRAAASDQRIRTITVKGYVQVPDEQQPLQVPSFIGDTSARRLLAIGPEPITAEQALRLFRDVAWDVNLAQ